MIFDKIRQWSENKIQPAGLTMQTITKVSDYFKENFGCPLPEGYVDFLNIMNGFSFDGYNIFCCYNDDIATNFPRYSSLDLVTFNTKFYNNTDVTDYIIIGKSSLDYIGYIKSTNKYVIMTNGTMQHLAEFDTFEDMLIKFFNL